MKILNDIEEAVRYLKEGKIIAYPTDTVYGLACKLDKEALDNLKTRKHRPQDKSLPIMVSDIKMMETIAYINEKEKKIIEHFMPGAMTIVLNKKPQVEFWVNDSKDTLAIRQASDERIKEIIKRLNLPIFLTSANFSNEKVCENIKEIEEKGLADAGFDGMPLKQKASTIVMIKDDKAVILREGPISQKEIEAVLNN